jgi:UDPglucose 6-dehydrogenase
MKITFIGHGYVGLVSAAVFADLGNTVWVIGHTPKKIANLKKGIIPIYEPGLEELVRRNIKAKRLRFTLDYTPAIGESEVVFIAVGTPPKHNGEADLTTVFEVARKIGESLDGYTVIATKSTVPVGTNRKIKEIIESVKPPKATFDIASVPEFLREGQAINDTRHPDRIVIGVDSQAAREILVSLHSPISGQQIVTTIETAEMIKYASNAFLATKISFANAIATLSEKVGANGVEVLQAMGLDRRIGSSFLHPGAGYGGSCFPKDVKALIAIAKQYGYDFALLKEVEAINKAMMQAIVSKAKNLLKKNLDGQTIGILGLSFKPNTDDMRDAPSLVVIQKLLQEGSYIKAYDPIALANASLLINNKKVSFAKDPYTVAENADLLIVMTDWDEFREIDLLRLKKIMRNPYVIDGRNIYDPDEMRALGFNYVGVGR